MPLAIGIIGMPNVGKSTLSNALTRSGAEASNYPFCTIDRNVGVAEVPDKKLWRLNELLKPETCTPTTIQFTDMAGLVKGASRGEGLGNTFLGHIRDVDAMIHVVRCFDDENVSHVDGSLDPVRDIDVVNVELALADLETAEKVIARLEKANKVGTLKNREELEVVARIRDGLTRGEAIQDLGLSLDELEQIRGYNFLTAKPVLYVANIHEAHIEKPSPYLDAVESHVGPERVIPISAKIEEEIAELEEDEQEAFLAEVRLSESGLTRIIVAGYRLLNLITFYTIANDKLRAWQIVRGTKSPEAAGKIHSDMERGFIRAEVASYEDVEQYKTMAGLHQRGLIRIEGRDYEVQDEDVIHFLFKI